ncbi:MAG: hypothetical protein EAZ55_01235 [Cytophagales bacterium]|nr:MAG: hypothetical protein EAZ55_01235 [Cytophagales bacterium]
MILYCANGGGLGHLTRAVAVLQSLKISPNNAFLLTASPHQNYFQQYYPTLSIPTQLDKNLPLYQQWLNDIITKYTIKTLLLDVFPTGILGEWSAEKYPSSLQYELITRLLNWQRYKKDLPINTKSPIYQNTYLTEPLSNDYMSYLGKQSQNIRLLTLQYPQENIAENQSIQEILNTPSYGLIIHSEPITEVYLLCQKALTLKPQPKVWYVCTQTHFPNHHPFIKTDINPYQITHLFEKAMHIVSACGFNIMQQTLKYRNKHHYYPMQRRYDLQTERAKQFQNLEHFDRI